MTERAGRFISLEGGEGVGKSTQARRLGAALRQRGIDLVETREPGGSPGAETIRGLLLQGQEDRWTPEAEALLFAAARADHVARTIRPALERGQWVLSDRFLDSSIAYQGGAAKLGPEAIRALHAFGSHGFLPDRTLLLDLSQEAAAGRAAHRDGGRVDRIGSRDSAFHADVAQTFRVIAQAEPRRVQLVDASGPADLVTERLMAAIADLL